MDRPARDAAGVVVSAWLISGGSLSLWGTALLLVHLCVQRFYALGYVAAWQRGWLPKPHADLPPIQFASDLAVTCWALAAGIASLIVFVVPAGHALPWVGWILPDHVSAPWAVLRLALAQVVMTGFVLLISPHPRWKLCWVACWMVFAFMVTV